MKYAKARKKQIKSFLLYTTSLESKTVRGQHYWVLWGFGHTKKVILDYNIMPHYFFINAEYCQADTSNWYLPVTNGKKNSKKTTSTEHFQSATKFFGKLVMFTSIKISLWQETHLPIWIRWRKCSFRIQQLIQKQMSPKWPWYKTWMQFEFETYSITSNYSILSSAKAMLGAFAKISGVSSYQ